MLTKKTGTYSNHVRAFYRHPVYNSLYPFAAVYIALHAILHLFLMLVFFPTTNETMWLGPTGFSFSLYYIAVIVNMLFLIYSGCHLLFLAGGWKKLFRFQKAGYVLIILLLSLIQLYLYRVGDMALYWEEKGLWSGPFG